MNTRVWSEGLYSSSNICLEGCFAEQLSSFQVEPMPSNSDLPGASLTLHKECENEEMLFKNSYYCSEDAGSNLIGAPRDNGHLSTRRHSPSTSCGHHEWNLNSGHQAKRARVENIIKGMTSSPGMHSTDVTTDQHEESDVTQDHERFQEVPLHQERHGFSSMSHSQMKREQLEGQHQHVRQLRTRFNHMDGGTDPADSWNKDKCAKNSSPETSPRDEYEESHSGFEGSSSRKYQGWKKVKLMNYFQNKPEKFKLMADVLKCELSRAVSRCVDSIFKSMPILQTSFNDEGNVETGVSLQSSLYKGNRVLSYSGNAEGQLSEFQTEALSLVVEKPRLERDKFILQSTSGAHHRPRPPARLSHDSALQEVEPPEKSHTAARQHALRCPQDGCSGVCQAKFETLDTQWNPVKVRSKVNTRSHASLVEPVLLQSLCLPRVKIESDGLVKNNLYMLNEGLTTSHLKKAKLMFFYSRYPSSQVLKTCFHDVQFTRCITSQLIKWFSNFREFFYIQMEKFARHALIEGVADVRTLTVGRESELFRALNMHYNKANDFQVPDRFLEVAEITLREFYVAISVGKDRDPSWKKAIYKVICKLDSDVPAGFRHHHCG